MSNSAHDDLEPYAPGCVPQCFGLNNPKALCYLNSLLQAIIGCSAVVQAALSNRDYLGRTFTGIAFYNFVYAAVPAARPVGSAPFNKDTTLACSSMAVLSALTADLAVRRPHIRYGSGQECASEGLVLLLDMMDDPSPRRLDDEIDEKTGTAIVIYEENPIARLFYHRYQAVVFCQLCKESVSSETDVAVQFNLFYYDELKKPPQTPREFSEMVRSQVSYLEGYRCNKCGEKAGGFRHYTLQMIPEVIVALFDIYRAASGSRFARYAPIRIPFLGNQDTLIIYRQVAQIEQFGFRSGGHYITRGLRADGRVYRFDDSSILLSAFKPTPDSYMLVYHCEYMCRTSQPSEGLPTPPPSPRPARLRPARPQTSA